MYSISGLFLTERINGVQRYALELLRELDKIVSAEDDINIIVPCGSRVSEKYNNIPIIEYGKSKGRLWEQLELPGYLRKHGREGIFLENVCPFIYPKGIVAIHDVVFKAKPQFFNSSLKGRIAILWRTLNYKRATLSNMKIVTVSEFSKSEIQKYYKVNPNRITVIYNSWQQMNSIAEDTECFEKYQFLTKGHYYFAMASLAPNKNYKWIVNAAKNNPEDVFAIAGGGDLESVISREEGLKISNLHFLGYVSDAEAKALMHHCKAFLFPTLYEGFGIPPLEAIASGAKRIIVSDTPCMHEIYGEYTTYIDPLDYAGQLPPISGSENTEDGDHISGLLDKYSWEKSAAKLYELIKS